MGKKPFDKALDQALWIETLGILGSATTFKVLRDRIWDVHEKSMPFSGVAIFAARYLNFFDHRDPSVLEGGFKTELRDALARIAREDPDDTKAAEYRDLIK